MTGAICEVLDSKMGFLKAAKLYGVPKTTLERKVKKARTNNYTSQDAAAKKLGRFEAVFTMDQEKDLVDHVLFLEDRLFGITLTDLRILAFELADKNKIHLTKIRRWQARDGYTPFLVEIQNLS